MNFTRERSEIDLVISNSTIAETDVIKDLGVFIDRTLNWNTHVEKKIASAFKCFFLIKNNIPFSAPQPNQITALPILRSYSLDVRLSSMGSEHYRNEKARKCPEKGNKMDLKDYLI